MKLLPRNPKWDKRFLSLAALVSTWSKDPSTGVGAVIAEGKRIVSTGFNGFPSKVNDTPSRLNDRETKYKLTLHAEENAIFFAGRNLTGCTIYTTHPPCPGCTSKIIQTGLSRVVTTRPNKEFISRWGADFSLSEEMFSEAEVIYDLLPAYPVDVDKAVHTVELWEVGREEVG